MLCYDFSIMAETTAQKVADCIIHFSHEHGDPITNLKLQKLVYYAQGWYLGLFDKPLFAERLEAWVHGPVQPTLYHKYKTYSWNPISEDPGEVLLSSSISAHLEEIMAAYGGMSAYDLERLSHQESPWLKARGDIPKDEFCEAVISTDEMRQFFKAMANEEAESSSTAS